MLLLGEDVLQPLDFLMLVMREPVEVLTHPLPGEAGLQISAGAGDGVEALAQGRAGEMDCFSLLITGSPFEIGMVG